ncbi:Hypothetical predicted protein [Cloeon dipterum]|uniref:CARD domain-containing protein n=1 Tax=Cloeon dipterum TaxID=197152 RepID=A0A8S1DFK9_9INSE|nr:Hypothetical predicted protein [Cloeon dipterum]
MMEDSAIDGLKHYEEAIKRDVMFDEIADKLVPKELLNGEEVSIIFRLSSNSKKMDYYLKQVLPTKNRGYALEFCEVLKEAGFRWIVDKIIPTRKDESTSKKRKSLPTEPKFKAATKNSENEDVVDAKRACAGSVENVAPAKIDHVNARETLSGDVKETKPEEMVVDGNLGVSKEMINIVSNDLYVLNGWVSLVHSLEMDSCLPQLRFEMALSPSSTTTIVTTLLKSWINMNPKKANLGALIQGLKESKFFFAASKLEDAFGTPQHGQ